MLDQVCEPTIHHRKIVGSFQQLPVKKFNYWMCYWYDMSYNSLLFEKQPIWLDEGWAVSDNEPVAVHPEVLEALGVNPIEWHAHGQYRRSKLGIGLYSDLFYIELTLPHIDGLPMLPTYVP